jgi:hypothetical protein
LKVLFVEEGTASLSFRRLQVKKQTGDCIAFAHPYHFDFILSFKAAPKSS